MGIQQGRLRVDVGFSENKGQGTYNGHITLHWPDKPAESYYYPGEPPFRTKEDAILWANSEVRRLDEKIRAASTRAKLITP